MSGAPDPGLVRPGGQECARCGQPASVRFARLVGATSQGTATLPLCDRCLRTELAGMPHRARFELDRFFRALAQQRDPSLGGPLTEPDAATTCAACGLTYAEFRIVGLAGCGHCYSAFGPAVRHALAVLHGA